MSYSLFFLKHFNTHINVQMCQSINIIKYLFKYIYKGGDLVMLWVAAVKNEVK
jgi:hypothetical protein